MKIIFFLMPIMASLKVTAGEMSKVDVAVRNAVISTYSERSNIDDFQMDYSSIWSLKIDESQIGCLLVVSGLAKEPLDYGFAVNKFWVCVNKDGFNYIGKIFEEKLIHKLYDKFRSGV